MGTRGALGFAAGGQLKIAYTHNDSYPGGLGIAVLHFVRQLVKDGEASIASAAQRVTELRVVTDDTPITPEDVEALRPWTNTNVGASTRPDGSVDRSLNWYQLLRETQGDPDAIMSSGYLLDASEFPLDSLYCEWTFIVDFDERVIEAYRGFQESPPTAGRWVGQVADDFDRQVNSLGVGYYPVEQVAVIGFGDLPSDAAFIRLLRKADEI